MFIGKDKWNTYLFLQDSYVEIDIDILCDGHSLPIKHTHFRVRIYGKM